MIINFNEFPDIALDCDVCIIGSGPAGTTIFDQLFQNSGRIILVESGDLEPNIPEIQSLNFGETLIKGMKPSRTFTNLVDYRLRCIGGTSNIWGGGCVPFLPEDFLERDYIPNSGWPINLQDLTPFYDVANNYMELTTRIFNEKLWKEVSGEPPYPFDFSKISTWFDVKAGFLSPTGYLNYPGPVKFRKYLQTDKVRKSESIVLYNATLTQLLGRQAGKVDYGIVMNYRGHERKIFAKTFVLAAGGFENPRLLLSSEASLGINPAKSNVGKYYLAKPFGFPADIVCENTDVATQLAWDFQFYRVGRNRAQPFITFSPEVQRRFSLLSTGIYLLGEYDPDSVLSKYANCKRDSRRLGLNCDFEVSDILGILREFDDIVYNGYRKLTGKGVRARMAANIPVFLIQEQIPNPGSRVTLQREKDRFGVRRIRLDWNFTRQDYDNVEKVLKIFADISRRHGWGRVKLRDLAVSDGDFFHGFVDAAHPSGTTRMSKDPQHGVVDTNLKMHGFTNLYVCGSSVFPTNSHVSPTYTIVALALRLAHHLKLSARSV